MARFVFVFFFFVRLKQYLVYRKIMLSQHNPLIRFILFTGIFLISIARTDAQSDSKVITLQYKEQIEITDDMSESEAEEECIQIAIERALENAFGRRIVQVNTTLTTNESSGKRAEGSSQFRSYSNSLVKGEWLRTIDKSCKIDKAERGNDYITCKVKGKARALPEIDNSVKLDLKTMNCPEERCQKDFFFHDEPFYMYLKSPEPGYIAIYLADQTNAYCILPFGRMKGNYFSVDADTSYVLFHQDKNYYNLTDKRDIHEYSLTMEDTKNSSEVNEIFVLYSKEEFGKPPLEKDQNDIYIPRHLSRPEFEDWLYTLRVKNPRLQVELAAVNIRNLE